MISQMGWSHPSRILSRIRRGRDLLEKLLFGPPSRQKMSFATCSGPLRGPAVVVASSLRWVVSRGVSVVV
jgi:hypothetical protein